MPWEMCGYKQYDDSHSAMNRQQVVPKYVRVQEYAIFSEVEETYGSDVVSYYLDSYNEAES